ncbi:hypothetical protein [Akkermansia sp.]|uniref:hypothetical protein n=1 Tax=Akkermansia sp. TaxID=1872421 RepID=UPI003A87E13E
MSAFTSSARPSFPIPASSSTRGTEAPFASFTLTGSVTASRQEMTTGSSPFASTHCAPADGSHSGTSIRPKILSSRFKNMLFTSGAFRPTESFRVTRTGSSWQQ